MRLITSSPEQTLAAVRRLSENAINHPLRRPLCSRTAKFRPWPPLPAVVRIEAVHRPWLGRQLWG